MRRTKIIATLGPATESEPALHQLLAAGTNVVRINLSHGHQTSHTQSIQAVRKWSEKNQQAIGILADLQGPKIRIGAFIKGSVTLKPGDTITMDHEHSPTQGDPKNVFVDVKQLPSMLKKGDCLLLDDGRIEFEVNRIKKSRIECTVVTGGVLSDHKGVNRKGGGLALPSLTSKDQNDLAWILPEQVAYLALSFVRHPDDLRNIRRIVSQRAPNTRLIAKIECNEALDHLDDIIELSDGVMVARGDLGVEVGFEEVPAIQKDIIRRARQQNTLAITATQMLDSMIHSTIPTRAEVSDIANAVLDGTDAVMLSNETAVGKHPHQVIATAHRICEKAELHPMVHRTNTTLKPLTHTDEAIARAAMGLANHLNIRAIIALTESGATPLYMSRIRSAIPIYGLTRHIKTQARLTLFRGVYPIPFDPTELPHEKVKLHALKTLSELGYIKTGDTVLLTKGDDMGVLGGTNTIKVMTV